ncbi:MAG: dTDP-4-dehydrorhamnose 3,5-epimerase [Kordiimonadaceae bacterium]|nr:dTDP-4-dehydrorhamnose 3,5-epimerase [Kordiimonadaceae bacterium]MBO6569477.1 dTDP-4-dehydrorhamnose 3,5-epimerase [Kordiimonadaceae bacterium]MBO6964952.1 dTDP-4-dehydrorhamnose 3,5-epimerase [Kordiimonadaceae bacterium]
MQIEELPLPGAFVLTPKRFGDDRGFFSETFSARAFEEIAPGVNFVQDNHSLSRDAGTLRGLHFQLPPDAQGKLVRVPRGRVLDVIVDVRNGSPTYGQHVGVELSGENWKQMWIPAGFAHAFCTLEPDTEFCYKVTDFYAPQSDSGLAFNDPDLGIEWPFPEDQLILSDKDRGLQKLKEFQSPFSYKDV